MVGWLHLVVRQTYCRSQFDQSIIWQFVFQNLGNKSRVEPCWYTVEMLWNFPLTKLTNQFGLDWMVLYGSVQFWMILIWSNHVSRTCHHTENGPLKIAISRLFMYKRHHAPACMFILHHYHFVIIIIPTAWQLLSLPTYHT